MRGRELSSFGTRDERGDGPAAQVVCAWCGGLIRRAAPKSAQRMCQPCFAHMMREHSRAHRQDGGLSYASDR
jgi:hypothetical protein